MRNRLAANICATIRFRKIFLNYFFKGGKQGSKPTATSRPEKEGLFSEYLTLTNDPIAQSAQFCFGTQPMKDFPLALNV